MVIGFPRLPLDEVRSTAPAPPNTTYTDKCKPLVKYRAQCPSCSEYVWWYQGSHSYDIRCDCQQDGAGLDGTEGREVLL